MHDGDGSSDDSKPRGRAGAARAGRGRRAADVAGSTSGAGSSSPAARLDDRGSTGRGGGDEGSDWDELGPQFLAYSAARNSPRYVVGQGQSLEHWRTFLETQRAVYNLCDVTPADVAAFAPWRREHKYRGKPVGLTACNRDLAALKALYSWAQMTEALRTNPTAPVTLAPEYRNVHGIRTVELEAFEKTIALLSERWRNAALAMMGTGMRWSSLTALTKKDLDADRRTVRLRRPKGKVGLELKVSERTFAALKAVVGTLYPDVSGFDGAVVKACERAKVPKWSAHMLRHTFACEVLRAGAALRDVQAWMGHASITTTERYLHHIRPSQPPAPV